MPDLDARFDCAVALALEAGALACAMRRSLGPIDAKSPVDFCTEADRAVERLIRARITARFGDAMIGEEDGGAPADDVWVVDPIDGTTGYIHDNGRWCVSIAFVRAGRIAFGVLFAPEANQLYTARAGGGAFLNNQPIQVSHLAHATAPLVEIGCSDRRPLSNWLDLVQGLAAAHIEFRRYGSGALGLADVARGVLDGYVEMHINAWDALAGILLVQEAGGWTNDFLADDGLTQGNRLIAVTPEVRATVERVVAGV